MSEYGEFIIKVSHAHLIAGSPFGTPYFHGEIVRCCDCLHYAGNEGLCMRLFNAMAVEPHGYCAWGLRRNDTENGMEVDG